MKRIIALMSGALLLVAGLCASCQKELGSQDEKSTTVDEVVVRATIAGNDTKVSFTVDGTNNKLKTAWEESDNIIGWDAEGNKIELEIADIEADGKTAIFKTVSGSIPTADNSKVYMIYAPGKQYSDITDKTTLEYNLSTQSLEKVPALMTATGTVSGGVLELTFANRLAIVAVKNPKFPVSAANKTITGLKLSGDNICTKATFSVDTDNELQMMSSDQRDITRGCNITPTADGTTSETMVYFAVLPGNSANVTISTTVPEGYQISFSNKSFTAGNCYLLANTVCLPAGALPGEFSVSATKKVYFSKGNLFYDGSKFNFEANQYDSTPSGDDGWSDDHISHFYWSIDSNEAIKDEYNWGQAVSDEDVFFTNATETTAKEGFTVNVGGIEQSGWRTLSTKEWQYLFNNHTKKWASVNGKGGYVIAPDGFTGELASSYADDAALASAGNLVFLPAAGDRLGSDFYDVGDDGDYWSSTAHDEYRAYYVYFDSSDVYPGNGDYRDFGFSVRLITESN